MHLLGVAGLLLLAFSGPFSGVPALTAVPNPILIGALVASAAVAARPRGEPVPFRALGPVALLLIALLVPAGFFIDASSVYATEKLLHLVTLVPLSVLAGATILQHPRARQLWLCGVVSVGTLMAVLGFLFPDAAVASAGRGWAVQGSNAIAAGLLTGAATLVLLAVGLHRRWDGILLLGAATPFLTLTVAAGSRGPLAALLVAALVVLYVTGAGRARVFCVTLAAGVVVAWLAGWLDGIAPDRLATFDDRSAQTRLILYRLAWGEAQMHPFGLGWGGLEPVYNGIMIGETPMLYPHNIVLEAAAEGGWVAALVLMWFVTAAVRRQARSGNSPAEMAMLGLTVFLVAAAFFSGDLQSHRAMWVMLGACLVAPATLPAMCETPRTYRSSALARRRLTSPPTSPTRRPVDGPEQHRPV